MGHGGAVEWVVIHARGRAGQFPVVGLRVEVDDAQFVLQQVDAGDEGLALNSVLVQVVRVAVRGGYQHHAVRHERLDQSAQDHGVRDIDDLELIETQHLGGLGDVRGNERHGVEVVAVLRAHLVQAFVHVLHEVVEMDARFGRDIGWQRVEEQIHQHRLARAHVAVHVQSLGQGRGDVAYGLLFLIAATEERAKEGFLLRLKVMDVGVCNFGRVVVLQRIV